MKHNYSEPFVRAWQEYRHHGRRSGKAASYRVWQRLGLDKNVDAVLQTIAGDKAIDGGHYTPAMEVWLKKHDFADLELDKAESEAPSAPVLPDHDWGKLVACAKSEALRLKLLHPRNGGFLYPETIILAVRDLASGIKKGPLTVERVIELSQERADAVRAEVKG